MALVLPPISDIDSFERWIGTVNIDALADSVRYMNFDLKAIRDALTTWTPEEIIIAIVIFLQRGNRLHANSGKFSDAGKASVTKILSKVVDSAKGQPRAMTLARIAQACAPLTCQLLCQYPKLRVLGDVPHGLAGV